MVARIEEKIIEIQVNDLVEKLRKISLWLENGEMAASEAAAELWDLAKELDKSLETCRYLEAIEQDETLKREFGPEIVEIIKEIELRALLLEERKNFL